MRIPKAVLAALLSFLGALEARGQDFGVSKRTARDVAIVELIADGEKFDGEIVRVVGAIRIEFEGDQLCLSKEAIIYRVFKNCLALGFNYDVLELTRQDLEGVSGEYVLLEGKFRSRDQGHLSLSSGSIREVGRLLLWEQVMAEEADESADEDTGRKQHLKAPTNPDSLESHP